MITGDPPHTASRANSPRKPIWPWAAGSILIPLVIVVATLAGARYETRARLAAQITPAPALPPLRVVSVIQPQQPLAQWAFAENSGRPLAMTFTYAAPSACLPGATCAAQPLGALTVYDAVSTASLASQPLAQSNLTPDEMGPCAALTEASARVGYLVCPSGVYRVALDSGQMTYAFSLGVPFYGEATLDEARQTLYLASNDSVYGVDLTSGALTGQAALSGAVSAPWIDTTSGQVFVIVGGGSSQPLLFALASHTLQTLGGAALPAGWRAGPWDGSAHRLYLFGAAGAVGAIDLSTPTLAPTAPYPALAVTPLAPLTGARALGWDTGGQSIVALDGDHLTAYDATSLKPYAWAPIAGVWDPQRPLPVDSAHGILYAPDASGAIAGISLAHPDGMAAPDAATAVALARAGLSKLMPAATQSPPFLDGRSLPLTTASLDRNFFYHYTDMNVWRGPYPGHVKLVAIMPGAQPGDYRATFAVDWNQLFVQVHTWTVELLPDGRVRMVTDTGDGIP